MKFRLSGRPKQQPTYFLNGDGLGWLCYVATASLNKCWQRQIISPCFQVASSTLLSFWLFFVTSTSAIEVQTRTFSFGSTTRSYTLGIPESAAEQTPDLVLAFHGAYQSKDSFIRQSKILEIADEFGVVVAVPSASNNWRGGPDSPEFADALLNDISSLVQFADGVGVMGYSQGGVFAYQLAEARSDIIKAAANVAASPPSVPLAPRPMPVIHIHGTADSISPYQGQVGGFLPAMVTVETLASNNRCDLTPAASELPDVDSSDGSTVTLLSYQDCARYMGIDGRERSADVKHYRINGGAHSWPGDANHTIFRANLDFDASRIILMLSLNIRCPKRSVI